VVTCDDRGNVFVGEDPMPADPSIAKTPLFRRSFVTSRYSDLADLATDMKNQVICHKALTGVLTLPVPSGSDTVVTVTDTELENALMAVGVIPKEGAEQTGATILWSNHAGDFVPYAILIDAAEPLWRSRTESQRKEVHNAFDEVIDPSFVIYDNQPVPSMILRGKPGETTVRYFIKTQGGTRSVALLTNTALPASGVYCTIQAVQTASTLYALAEKTEDILTVIFSPKAPWED
jgi:hypothetical protein